MASDSDRTVDSDELEEIISKAKKGSPKKNSKVLTKFHDLSDSDSDLPSPNKKVKVAESPTRPVCKYGSKCYRKNEDHKRNFYHPTDSKLETPSKYTKSEDTGLIESVKKYQFFVTRVKGIPSRYNSTVAYDIKDLLSLPDGSLVSSIQFNYMFDIEWLMLQYPEKYRKCPLTIVHGEQRESKQALERSAAKYSNIKFCQAKLDIPFGTHHTKMMFLLYKEGFRIVIHTSNIVESDWAQKTQGMWVSPLLPPLKDQGGGESPTGFKADLLEYLSSYAGLEEWRGVVQRHDFSAVRVVLIGSVPGRHVGSRKTAFGHLKVRKVLRASGPSVGSDWPVVGQFSSIGSLGPNPEQWLKTEWAASMASSPDAQHSPTLKLIYPSVENVRKSLEGYPAGASLPYSIKVAQKQPYLTSFLHRWKSDAWGRSEASPHIKTYLRLAPDHRRVAWFLLTSANMSKAAWGALEKKGAQLMIRSYELGVLFLPRHFGLSTFPCAVENGGDPPFPVPYDIPLEPYSRQDEPWIWDVPHVKGPDRFGNMWCPP